MEVDRDVNNCRLYFNESTVNYTRFIVMTSIIPLVTGFFSCVSVHHTMGRLTVLTDAEQLIPVS